MLCEIRNVMRDAGDGTVFEQSNITILRYAGDDRWAGEEDVYNPGLFLKMVKAYLRHGTQLGTVSDAGRAWAAAMNIRLDPQP